MAAPPPAPESALAALAAGPLAGAEQTLWEGRPSPMLAILRATLRTGIALAIAPGSLCALQLFAYSDRNPGLRDMLGWYRAADRHVPLVRVAIALAAVIVVNGIARVVHALKESLSQYYRVTTQRIVSQMGILSKRADPRAGVRSLPAPAVHTAGLAHSLSRRARERVAAVRSVDKRPTGTPLASYEAGSGDGGLAAHGLRNIGGSP